MINVNYCLIDDSFGLLSECLTPPEINFLKDFELIKDTGIVKVKYSNESEMILILDYDNFPEGSGVKEEDIGKEFNNKFIIKTVDNLGRERILNKSSFDLRRFREKERLNAIDIFIWPEPCEKRLDTYKKNNGELVFSLKFKVFSSKDNTELCPSKNKKSIWPKKDFIIEKDIKESVVKRNIFKRIIDWILKLFK